MPLYKGKASVAVAWLSRYDFVQTITFASKKDSNDMFSRRWTEGTPLKISCALYSLVLDHPAGYASVDLFTGVELGTFKPR